MRTSIELRQRRAGIVERLRAITDAAQAQNRNLSDGEGQEYDRLEAEFEGLSSQIERVERQEQREADGARSISGGFGNLDGTQSRSASTVGAGSRVLTREQSVADFIRSRGGGDSMSLGRLVRGMVTNEWRGAGAEQRALSESVSSAGGVLLPSPMMAGMIDLARAQSRVLQAGASTVPMDSATLKIARQTSDPTLQWHTEGATISESDLAFDSVTLKAKTLPCRVRFSVELSEDVEDLDRKIEQAVSAAMAIELDRVALRGSGTDPEPRGIRNTSGVTIINAGTNGAPATWDMLADGTQAVETANFTPNGAIMHTRTKRDLETQRENGATGAYLAAPPYLEGVPRYGTTNLPTNLTHGTSTNASELYVGQWSELLIGLRHNDVRVIPLVESFASTGELGLWIYMRADVQLARPAGFAVVDGVTPAA